jgi:hypothetical protein
MIHQISDRQQDLAFRPAYGDRRAHQFLKSRLKCILASDVPALAIVYHRHRKRFWLPTLLCSNPVSGSIVTLTPIMGTVPMMSWIMPMAVMTIADRLNRRLNFRLRHIHSRRG